MKLSKSIKLNQTVTINLNGKTVTIKNFEKSTDVILLLNKETSYSVGFVDGTIKTESKTENVANINMLFCVGNNATLNLKNVTTEACAGTGIYCVIEANPATINIDNCTLEGFYAYGVGTNAASAANTFINLTITESTIATKDKKTLDNTGLLINIPGKVVIKNSVISGDRQGIILRGTGSDVVEIIDSTINVTAAGTVKEGDATNNGTCNYADRTSKWGNGNEVALAALVIGNSETTGGSYQSGTAVDLRDVTINLCENYKGKHIWVTQASGTYKVVVSGENNNSWTTNKDMHGATYFGCSTWDGSSDTSWYNENETEGPIL